MRSKRPGVNRRPLVALCGLLALTCLPRAAADDKVAGKEITALRDDEYVTVKHGDRLLLRYCCEGASNKPYVKELTSPAGVNVLRDSPPDHKHHRGLMFAVRVNGVGFWDEAKGSGTQEHQQWRSLRVVPVRIGAGKDAQEVEAAVLRQHVVWKDQDRKPLLEEDRVLSVYAGRPGQPRLLTWQSTFTIPAGAGAATLTGSAYFGLGARFLPTMDSGGRLQNSAGGTDAAGTNAKQAAWCAFIAEPSKGKPITFTMFDSPGNRRHPARWFTMNKPFAYLSATLGLDKEPLQLDPGQRLTLRYGVAIFDGAAKKEELDAACTLWKSLPAEVRTGTAPGLIGRYFAAKSQATDGRRPMADVVRIDRCVAFDWSDGTPDDRLPAGPFTATWAGDLFVDAEGAYRFALEADGEAKAWVGDRQVAGPGAANGPVKLEYGFHPLRVDYQAAAKPRIKLLWQFKDRTREVISQRHLAHSREAAAAVQTAVAHEHGREVVEHYGCARCHRLTGLDQADKPGPPLNRVSGIGAEYLRRWLADPQSVRPGTTMPSFHKGAKAKVDDTERQAVAAFLRSLPMNLETAKKLEAKNRYRQRSATELPSGSFQGGRELFHKLGCIACHDPEDPSNAEPDEAPSLVDIGAKWSRGALLRFLEDPLLWHPQGRMPDFKLTEMEAADLAAYLSTFRKMANGQELPEPDAQPVGAAAQPTPEMLTKGKNLVERHGCTACHDMEGVAKLLPNAPPLDRYTLNLAGRGCLGEGQQQPKALGPVPHFTLSEEDRAAVAEFLARRPQQASQVAAQEIGDRLVHGSRQMCLHCHTRDGEGEDHLGRATLRYLGKTTGQGTKALAMTPPDLSGVGGKLRPEWIRRVLEGQAPSPRPWLSIRMPRFALSDAQRQAMVARLVTADTAPAEAYAAPPKVANDHAAAATLLGPKGFSCANCHYLGKYRPPADTVGPDLALASQRVTREWFLRWLEDPARIRPGTPMPALVQPVPKVAGGKLDVQKEILWKYLSTTPPSQMVLSTEAARNVAVLGPRPTLVQGRVLGAAPLNAPRSVAIGLTNGHSLLFDAGKLAWLGHWKGDFLRETGLHGARHHWVPAGQVLWKTELPLSPILFCAKSSGAWLTPAAWRDRFGWHDEVSYEGRGVRLKYRLRSPDAANPDPDEGPWIEVAEWIEPNPPGDSEDGYTRRIQVRGLPAKYDAVIPVSLEAAAKLTTRSDKLTLGDDNLVTLPTATAVVGGRTVVVRVTALPGSRWAPALTSITQPVLQPFTDQPVKPGQRFDPIKQPGKTGPALLVPNSHSKNILEVTIQIATAASGQPRADSRLPIADGPPRTWPKEPPPLPARSNFVSEPVKPGELSESTALSLPPGFQVKRLPLPEDFLVCGLAFWKGKLLVGGYDGEIRIALDTDGDGLPDRYRFFAGILDQINNLRVYGDHLYATTPGGVYRIRDRDNNGLADSFEIVSSAWDWSGHAYDWTFGLVRDAQGNLYAATTTPHERPNLPGLHMRGAVVKIAPDGKTKQVGTGTRYNFGFAQNKAGRMYFNVNQGHWNITCGIHEVVEGAHYGFGEPDLSKVLAPVVRVPYPWCRALTGMDFAEKTPAFGPFQDQGFAADYNTRRVIRWTDDPISLPSPKPAGEQREPAGSKVTRQGTCYGFLDGLDAGPTEIVFGPDGALYVGFMSDASWYPERARGGIYKVTYTGPPPFAVRTGRLTRDGFAIELTEPADPATVKNAACVRVHRYFHQYKGNYHSEEIAHEDVPTQRVELSADRRTLLVTTAAHVTPRIYRVQLRGIRSTAGRPLDRGEMYFTVHVVPK